MRRGSQGEEIGVTAAQRYRAQMRPDPAVAPCQPWLDERLLAAMPV